MFSGFDFVNFFVNLSIEVYLDGDVMEFSDVYRTKLLSKGFEN